jgi:hypothetical protein
MCKGFGMYVLEENPYVAKIRGTMYLGHPKETIIFGKYMAT